MGLERDEAHRPQFHFTCQKGWLCDINGPVYYGGEYHLFYEYNPADTTWIYTNMHWGHAVGTDLIHWQELPPVLAPDEGGPINSGSAAVDWKNTSELQSGEENVLVALYTEGSYLLPSNKPAAQSLAYSNDRGRTWTKYAGNPVVGATEHYARDPKFFWHEPTKKWIMTFILSENGNEHDNTFGLFSSPNLKDWILESKLDMPTACDCPDMFELPLDDDPNDLRWVFWGGNGTHAIGDFDGKTFTPEGNIHLSLLPLNENGANGFAAQVFSDIPASDGRTIQIAWLRNGEYPGMEFNQQMTFPCELSLRTFPEGIRLCRLPAREIEILHREHHRWEDGALSPGENPLSGISGELFDIRTEIELGEADEVVFELHGQSVVYDAGSQKLSCLGKEVELAPVEGVIVLHILLDRNSIEIFANKGEVSLSFSFLPQAEKIGLRLEASGGNAKIRSLDVYELESIWG